MSKRHKPPRPSAGRSASAATPTSIAPMTVDSQDVPSEADPGVKPTEEADEIEGDLGVPARVPVLEPEEVLVAFEAGVSDDIADLMSAEVLEGAPLDDGALTELLLDDVCAVLGIPPAHILGAVRLERPAVGAARVRFVTAGGFKVVWPPDEEMFARLRRAYGLPADADLELRPFHTLPESCVTGAVTSASHRFPGGYLRRP